MHPDFFIGVGNHESIHNVGFIIKTSNDVEFKLAKFLQLIGTIKRTIFKKVRMETILKIYNTIVLPTFYMGQKIGF